MKNSLSPKQLAQAVGVSESSMKRWADEGLIHVSRTRGGHRRIPIAEAARFIRDSRLDVVDPAPLGMNDLAAATEAPPAADPAEAFHRALEDGRAPQARGMIVGMFLQGQPVARIFDEVLAPALNRIGTLYRHGDEGIYIEHRATDICIQTVNQLRSLIVTPPDNAPRAVGGALSDDPYILPSLMAATVLAAEGFVEVNLGADTPASVLRAAAQRYRAALVWISCATAPDPEQVNESLDRIADHCRWNDSRLVAGGRALEPPVRLPTSAHQVHTMSELSAFAAGLR